MPGTSPGMTEQGQETMTDIRVPTLGESVKAWMLGTRPGMTVV